MKRHAPGFTLIELMVVIAILSILSTLSMPTFQDRIIQSQIEEGVQMTADLREAVATFYRTHKRFPKDNAEAGIPKPAHLIGNFVTGITLADGALHVTLGHKVNEHAAGRILSFRPAYVAESPASPLSWLCGYSEPVPGMTAAGENRSNVPKNFLHPDCRW